MPPIISYLLLTLYTSTSSTHTLICAPSFHFAGQNVDIEELYANSEAPALCGRATLVPPLLSNLPLTLPGEPNYDYVR
jgi:hypothetical protein